MQIVKSWPLEKWKSEMKASVFATVLFEPVKSMTRSQADCMWTADAHISVDGVGGCSAARIMEN